MLPIRKFAKLVVPESARHTLKIWFDADYRDPLAQLNWVPDDFAWVTGQLMDFAGRRCANRIVSLLEGGYDRAGLAAGVTSHVAMLQDGALGVARDRRDS